MPYAATWVTQCSPRRGGHAPAAPSSTLLVTSAALPVAPVYPLPGEPQPSRSDMLAAVRALKLQVLVSHKADSSLAPATSRRRRTLRTWLTRWWAFAGTWTRAMGFLGAVAGSAAGALLSSTRGGTRPREHAMWMAFGAAMGIEGAMLTRSLPYPPS